MVYARLIAQQACIRFTIKLVAETMDVYKDYKESLENDQVAIIDEFIDEEFGTVVFLPNNFKYKY